MKKLNPREDRVIIEPDKALEEIAGLLIPESSRQKPNIGMVIAVGPGLPGKPIEDLKVGDKVHYGKYAGTDVQDPNDDKRILIIMRQGDIWITETEA